MRNAASIAEWPIPPKRRLAFPRLILQMISNPVECWSEDFYREKLVVYRWLGLESAFVMDPPLDSERAAGRRRELFEAAAQRRRFRRGDRRRVCSTPKARHGAGSGG